MNGEIQCFSPHNIIGPAWRYSLHMALVLFGLSAKDAQFVLSCPPWLGVQIQLAVRGRVEGAVHTAVSVPVDR